MLLILKTFLFLDCCNMASRRQPVGFVTFSTRSSAEAAKQDLQVRSRDSFLRFPCALIGCFLLLWVLFIHFVSINSQYWATALGFYLVLPAFHWFYLVCLGFTGFYRVLLGFTGFYPVFLGFSIETYWVFTGFTGFY